MFLQIFVGKKALQFHPVLRILKSVGGVKWVIKTIECHENP